MLEEKFGIRAHVQVVPVKGEGRTLYLIENAPVGRRTTLAGLERLCHRIAKALNAELYGTVNLDFVSTGSAPNFEMIAEVLD